MQKEPSGRREHKIENVYKKSKLIWHFSNTDYLSPIVVPTEITDLLESSDVVGNIRFSHPTLYVFPGGQGDAALFGINGFNMLGECASLSMADSN